MYTDSGISRENLRYFPHSFISPNGSTPFLTVQNFPVFRPIAFSQGSYQSTLHLVILYRPSFCKWRHVHLFKNGFPLNHLIGISRDVQDNLFGAYVIMWRGDYFISTSCIFRSNKTCWHLHCSCQLDLSHSKTTWYYLILPLYLTYHLAFPVSSQPILSLE